MDQTREEGTESSTVGPELREMGKLPDSPGSTDFLHRNRSEISELADAEEEVARGGRGRQVFDSFRVENETIKWKNLSIHQPDYANLDVRETAGFAAIGFLAFSVIGYVAFVLWRRYLQNKYGNGQTLITEEAYDISDLRHFEI